MVTSQSLTLQSYDSAGPNGSRVDIGDEVVVALWAKPHQLVYSWVGGWAHHIDALWHGHALQLRFNGNAKLQAGVGRE